MPRRPNIEEELKASVHDALKRATRDCKKGRGQGYEKTHGFDLIGLIDPQLVCRRSPRAMVRLCNALGKALWLPPESS